MSHTIRTSENGAAPNEVLAVPVRWDAVFAGEARAVLERALRAFIPARRWYRTKTKNVQSATIVAACPLMFGPDQEQMQGQARIVLAELLLDDGARETYVVPLAFVGGDVLATPEGAKLMAIMPLRAGTLDGAIVDALGIEAFANELLVAMGRNEKIEEGKATMQFHGLAPIRDGKGTARARVLSGEQTNTSILFGDKWVGKVVRKIDSGESADLEMGRFLTGVGYTHTPELAGWIDVKVGHEAPSTVALLHGFVPNRGDAWGHALAVLDGWLASVSASGGGPPALPRGDLLTRAMAPLPAELTSAVGHYVALAEKLGQRVGEMHAALVSRPDDRAFRAEPLDRETRTVIASAARDDLGGALDALSAREADLPEGARAALASVRSHTRSLEARLAAVSDLEDAGVKMRVHGDLHLGQVLFTGSDFMLIDFEGEPARPLAERKAKRSPLVDVAGMLRSYHYAAVSALRATPENARAALAPWANLWQEVATASFLRGWLGAVRGSAAMPRDPAATRSLLDLFLLEKAVYEVRYEMNNRPDWIEIPLQGLRAILGAEGAEGGASAQAGSARPSSPAPRPSHPPIASSLLDPRSPRVAAFMAGTSTHAHRFFGAHPHQDGATDFAVWAPHASRVAVVGDFNGWDGEAAVLAPLRDAGIHAGRVPGAAPGQRYKLRITPAPGAGAGAAFDKADPFGFMTEVSPGNASVIATLDYPWGDGEWMEKRVQNARMDLPISIYEVHLGSWRRSDSDPERLLGYREIAAPLAEHARALGFTHVELMPLLEHPFYGSWGYGVTGFFAATSRYGSPADLMFLIDTLHRAGLGVILDWVPAHFARDPQGLATFDGAPLFESADPARAVHPTWGSGVFDLARPEVRSFLLSSATFWIETFHADGLRVDGVESILYLDHHGGAEDEAGVAFLRELTTALKAAHPEVILAAEDSSPWKGVTHAVKVGGLGFDLKWDMGFSHDLRRYLAIDPIQRSQHQGALTFRSVYSATDSFVLPLSHDDVIEERGGAILQQMHGDPWQKLANLRLLYSMAWAQPGKKLLFMGDEFAQPGAWHHDRGLDWRASHEPAHEGIARMVGDLNRVYRELSALHAGDALASGFEWIDGSNAEMSIIAFARRGRSDEDVMVVVCNFTPVPRHQYRVGMPRGGHWREVFNSDARDYGGSGHGNLGGIDAVPYPWNGRQSSVVLTLPPLGAIFLARG